jgi:hypothetical protein
MGGFAAYSEPTQRGLVISCTAIVIVALIAAVSVLAYFGVLSGPPAGPSVKSVYYSIIISAPETLPEFDIRQISWKPDECFLNYSGKRKQVTPVRVLASLGFEIRCPPGFFDEISHAEPLNMELVDTKGLVWQVASFFLYQTSVSLVCEDKAKVLQAYGDGDEQ